MSELERPSGHHPGSPHGVPRQNSPDQDEAGSERSLREYQEQVGGN
jgi:hypothetical protein